MSLRRLIESHWQQPNPWLTPLLLPVSRLFASVAARRRQGYLKGRRAEKLPVPVAVVGNLHAGGTGKTPVVQSLIRALTAQGICVGIVSRGYGRRSRSVHLLTPESTAAEAGDEPLLLYRTTGIPTAVADRRADAARALLAACPDIRLIVSDDGLQHYALHRDYEIAVFPAADVGRSLALLPHGPLREGLERLHEVDAVIVSQCPPDAPAPRLPLPEHVFQGGSRPIYGRPYRLGRPHDVLPEGALCGKTLIAAAAVARPERFFAAVSALGLSPARTIAFPDHAVWQPDTLPPCDAVITTEKDAVKLHGASGRDIWVLPLQAALPDGLTADLLHRCGLNGKAD